MLNDRRGQDIRQKQPHMRYHLTPRAQHPLSVYGEGEGGEVSSPSLLPERGLGGEVRKCTAKILARRISPWERDAPDTAARMPACAGQGGATRVPL